MRFLIAEDDLAACSTIEALLTAAFPSAQEITCENGRLALAEFERTGADLVVCARDMMVTSGTALVRCLRRLQPTLPILMITTGSGARVPRVAAGITDVLETDLVRGELINRIIRLVIAGSIEFPHGFPAHAVAA